jgi:hypothetical protein
MDLGEIELGGIVWINLPQDGYKWRNFVNTSMNFRFTSNFVTF